MVPHVKPCFIAGRLVLGLAEEDARPQVAMPQ